MIARYELVVSFNFKIPGKVSNPCNLLYHILMYVGVLRLKNLREISTVSADSGITVIRKSVYRTRPHVCRGLIRSSAHINCSGVVLALC